METEDLKVAENQLNIKELNDFFCNEAKRTNERINKAKECYVKRFGFVGDNDILPMAVYSEWDLQDNIKNALSMAGNGIISGLFFCTDNHILRKQLEEKTNELDEARESQEDAKIDLDELLGNLTDIITLINSISDMAKGYTNTHGSNADSGFYNIKVLSGFVSDKLQNIVDEICEI